MKKIFVGNLPPEANEESVREMFAEFGIVRSIEVKRDLFTGKCRGHGFVEMEGHEARAAMAALDGKTVGSAALRVRYEADMAKRRGRR
jgi:RNA recognition motif-containing protein